MFTPDQFQTDSIEGVTVRGNNVIVCAPTGSGKTHIASECIKEALDKSKIVIYTTPIKALSNEKYAALRKIFPNVGLVTGDFKCNIDANVLIMTTEIYNQLMINGDVKYMVDSEEMSRTIPKNEIGLVIFDEAHYLNDESRGQVWEESIINSSPETKMLLLSATISNPTSIQQWIERIKPERDCELVQHHVRPVPLTHSFFQVTQLAYEKDRTKDPSLPFLYGNKKFMPVMESGGSLNLAEARKIFKSAWKVKESLLGGQGMITYLKDALKHKDMLPAIFFVFSCNKCEQYALGTSSVYDKDTSNVNIIHDRLMHLIKGKKNSEDIIKSKTFNKLLACVQKGVAWHHAGMLPILKDAVEIMFGEGHIKILFATETFAVGVNYPARTVVFTSMTKRTEQGFQPISSFNYHQMAGRAGRRGHDTQGYVVHVPNMSKDAYDPIEDRVNLYRKVLGKPNNEICRIFTISPKLLLQGLSGETSSDPFMFIRKMFKNSYSMRHIDFTLVKDPVFERHLTLFEKSKYNQLTEEESIEFYQKEQDDSFRLAYVIYLNTNRVAINTRGSIKAYYDRLFRFCVEAGLVSSKDDGSHVATLKGGALMEIGERVNSLALLELFEQDYFDTMEDSDVVAMISVFVETTAKNDHDDHLPCIDDLHKNIARVGRLTQEFGINDYNWDYQTRMYNIVKDWIDEPDRNIHNLSDKWEMCEGHLYKSLLRIKSVLEEIAAAASVMRKHELASRLKGMSVTMCSKGLNQDSLYLS